MHCQQSKSAACAASLILIRRGESCYMLCYSPATRQGVLLVISVLVHCHHKHDMRFFNIWNKAPVTKEMIMLNLNPNSKSCADDLCMQPWYSLPRGLSVDIFTGHALYIYQTVDQCCGGGLAPDWLPARWASPNSWLVVHSNPDYKLLKSQKDASRGFVTKLENQSQCQHYLATAKRVVKTFSLLSWWHRVKLAMTITPCIGA